MTKNLKEIVLQQIYDILVGKENEIDKLKVLITLLQTLNGDELINGSEKTIPTSKNNYKSQVYKLESTSDIIETWNESPCKSCSNYLQAKASGTPLICNCTLGLSEIR
jgi:hypothetical protein